MGHENKNDGARFLYLFILFTRVSTVSKGQREMLPPNDWWTEKILRFSRHLKRKLTSKCWTLNPVGSSCCEWTWLLRARLLVEMCVAITERPLFHPCWITASICICASDAVRMEPDAPPTHSSIRRVKQTELWRPGGLWCSEAFSKISSV